MSERFPTTDGLTESPGDVVWLVTSGGDGAVLSPESSIDLFGDENSSDVSVDPTGVPLGTLSFFVRWSFEPLPGVAIHDVRGASVTSGGVILNAQRDADIRLGVSGGTWIVMLRPTHPRVPIHPPNSSGRDERPSGVKAARTTVEAGGPQKTLGIGRRPGRGGLAIYDPLVAAVQARATQLPDGSWHVADIGSKAALFVHGQPVLFLVGRNGDQFSVGSTTVAIGPYGLSVVDDRLAGPAIAFDRVAVRYKSKRDAALEEVSFFHPEGVLAIIGPSGAGKSTSLKALLGEVDVVDGRIFVGSIDIVQADRRYMQAISAYVPQEDDLFANLSVSASLQFALRLRSSDLTTAEVESRLAEVADLLGITHILSQRVSEISGGQRKRVSVATELVGAPRLLMLDEPTSGLDAGRDRALMLQLRQLARIGCTVVVVTHSTDNLLLADRVLAIARGSRPAYCGPPAALRASLMAPDASMADLMDRLDRPTGDTFAAYREPPMAPQAQAENPGPIRRHSSRRWISIVSVLMRRQIELIRCRGRRQVGALLLGPAVGVAAAVMASDEGLSGSTPVANPQGSIALAILVTIACLTGTSLTYSDIVTERSVLHRDARVGVTAGQIVVAKSIVFGVLASALAALTAWSYFAVRPSPDVHGGTTAVWLGLGGAYVASMALGMAISAWSVNLERAVALSTIASIAQVALNGILFTLPSFVAIAASAVPARWATATAASGIDLNRLRDPQLADAMWERSNGRVTIYCAILVGLTVLYLVGAWYGLRRSFRSTA